MRIGLISMSAKPYHVGHHEIVMLASKENDEVILFTSLSDRRRPREFPILGKSMERIWNEILIPIMPDNVNVEFVLIPVRSVYEVLGDANTSDSKNVYTIYSDDSDILRSFPESSRKKYFGNIYLQEKVKFRGVSRLTTKDISGTQMRKFLHDDDKKNFLQNLPSGIDGNKMWNILKSDVKNESFMRGAIRCILFSNI